MPTPRHCDNELKFKNRLLLKKLLLAKQHRLLPANKNCPQVLHLAQQAVGEDLLHLLYQLLLLLVVAQHLLPQHLLP
jgi:hypothetical protein